VEQPKEKGRIKADENCKGLRDRFVVASGRLLVSIQRRVQLQAPKLLIVAMSV